MSIKKSDKYCSLVCQIVWRGAAPDSKGPEAKAFSKLTKKEINEVRGRAKANRNPKGGLIPRGRCVCCQAKVKS